MHTYTHIYIYIYRDVIIRQRPPVAPQSTGGLRPALGHRWPPQKVVAPTNIEMEHKKDERRHGTLSKYAIPMVSYNRYDIVVKMETFILIIPVSIVVIISTETILKNGSLSA